MKIAYNLSAIYEPRSLFERRTAADWVVAGPISSRPSAPRPAPAWQPADRLEPQLARAATESLACERGGALQTFGAEVAQVGDAGQSQAPLAGGWRKLKLFQKE